MGLCSEFVKQVQMTTSTSSKTLSQQPNCERSTEDIVESSRNAEEKFNSAIVLCKRKL